MSLADELNTWIERIERGELKEEWLHRPTWDEYFTRMVFLVARRSTCIYHRTGAIMVKEHRVLTTGYSGSPSGIVHCTQVGCTQQKWSEEKGWPPDCRGIGAIMNSIIQAALFGIDISGATLYTNEVPDLNIIKILINLKIRDVRFVLPAEKLTLTQEARRMAEDGGIQIKSIEMMDVEAMPNGQGDG